MSFSIGSLRAAGISRRCALVDRSGAHTIWARDLEAPDSMRDGGLECSKKLF